MISFSHQTYVRLLKTSSELAKQYRIDCGLDKPEVISNETPKNDITQATGNIEAPSDVISFTKEELQEKLTNAGIKFSNLAKEETLLKKCLEFNLV